MLREEQMYQVLSCDAEEGCEKIVRRAITVRSMRTGKPPFISADGWYKTKDGRDFCPDHRAPIGSEARRRPERKYFTVQGPSL